MPIFRLKKKKRSFKIREKQPQIDKLFLINFFIDYRNQLDRVLSRGIRASRCDQVDATEDTTERDTTKFIQRS